MSPSGRSPKICSLAICSPRTGGFDAHAFPAFAPLPCTTVSAGNERASDPYPHPLLELIFCLGFDPPLPPPFLAPLHPPVQVGYWCELDNIFPYPWSMKSYPYAL
ncbi:hypothetical protein C8R44DRAFT_989650 [Mycena epipterygia]|nr:hypothetical protein C8R44DRAFT_989650 [Mycena epipterygia]